MVLFYILLFVGSLVLTYNKYHSLLKINFIYTLIWCLGAILVSLRYGKLYTITDNVHLYIILSIITVNIFYFLNNVEVSGDYSIRWEISHLNYQVIVLGSLLSYIFMLPITYRAIRIILSSGWFELRSYAYSASSMASAGQLLIYSWIINPLFSATFLLTSILWFSKSKYKRTLMLLSIIDLMIITITFGGRYNIVKFILFFISAFQFYRSFKGQKNKIKLKYIILGFCIGALLIYMTSLRSLKGLSAIQNVFVYFFGSIVYFSLIITDGYSPLNSTKLYGNATFGLFTSIPMYLYYQVSKRNYTPEYLIDQTSNDFLYISPGYRYNAFTTWLFPFWKDFGIIGIIIGSAFVFYLFCRLKRKLICKGELSSFVLLVYVSYVILTSTLSYNMITIQQTVTILFSLFLSRESYQIDSNEE